MNCLVSLEGVLVEHPPPAGVVKLVCLPLVLQELEPLRVQEEGLPPPQVLVLLPEGVEVEGAPDAGPLAPDDDDGGQVLKIKRPLFFKYSEPVIYSTRFCNSFYIFLL